MVVIGIVEQTGSPYAHRQVWRVTFDGRVLGDSKGFYRDGAIADAKKTVARDPVNRMLDPKLCATEG